MTEYLKQQEEKKVALLAKRERLSQEVLAQRKTIKLLKGEKDILLQELMSKERPQPKNAGNVLEAAGGGGSRSGSGNGNGIDGIAIPHRNGNGHGNEENLQPTPIPGEGGLQDEDEEMG